MKVAKGAIISDSLLGHNSDLAVCELKLARNVSIFGGENLTTVQAQKGIFDVVVQALCHNLVALVWVLLHHVFLCQVGEVRQDHW